MKQQTIGDFIADSLDKKKFRKRLESLNKQPRESYARCEHCPDEANYHKESELFWDDTVEGYLCEECLKEEERGREAEDEVNRIIEEEKINHYKGGI